jgi:hypothetical protein
MRSAVLGALLLAVLVPCLFAHPGSALGVTGDGRIYFVDTGAGVFSIVRPGTVARHDGPAFHWFAIDPTGRFRTTPWPRIPGGELRAVGTNPTIVLSSDMPVAIAGDTFYYPEIGSRRIRMFSVAPSGQQSVRAELPPVRSGGEVVSWLNGLAAGPDGSLYYTEDRAVRKIDARGRVTLVANVGRVPGCVTIPGIGPELGPYLRGLAIAPDGTIYVAASGCGAVLSITPRGKVKTILRTSAPWAPTAVAMFDGEIFIQEYLHTPSDNRREWIPRVRKIGRDGAVTTLVNTAPR